MAWTSLRAAGVLHKAGIVHADFRLQNIVWLDDEHCMVIDLECCKIATDPLPEGFAPRHDWDDGTLVQMAGGKSFFTPASELYQIGRMLQKVLKAEWSQAAHSFVGMLLSKSSQQEQGRTRSVKQLDVDAALQHVWLGQL